MDSVFIEDGYSREVTIPEAPGLYPALSVRYRPALAAERYDYLRAQDVNGREQAARVARLLKRHLESWDARRRDGTAVEVSEEALARLQPQLLARLLDIVLGYAAAEETADAKN